MGGSFLGALLPYIFENFTLKYSHMYLVHFDSCRYQYSGYDRPTVIIGSFFSKVESRNGFVPFKKGVFITWK